MNRSETFRIAVRKYPPFEEAIRAQWQAFARETQTTLALDLVSLDLSDLEHALFGSGGMVRGDWDVAFVATDWISAMHAQGAAVDLAPMLAQEPPPGFPDAWSPSLLRLQRMGPAVLGVPYHDGPECLIFRRDVFERHGLIPPTTWTEFHRIARLLQDEGAGLYGTGFAAFPDGHNSVYDFLLQLWTRGGELFDADGRLHFQTAEANEALSFYRDLLADSGAVHPACGTLDSVALGKLFTEGALAMMVNWFGFASYAHTAADSGVRGQVEMAAIPSGTGGRSASLNVYWILALAAGSPHRKLAWQFLRHTQAPAMDLLTSTAGAIGCRRSTWADPTLNAAIPFYHQLEALHRTAREIPQRPDWPRIARAIDALVTATLQTARPIATLLAQADAAWAAEATGSR